MSFHSNYPHTDLFIHKSSIAEVSLIIPSYVLNFALCSTNMEGGKSWQNISAEEQERLDAQCPTHTSNVPPWAWHAFPGKKKALFQCAQVPSRAIETILYLWPVWDRRTRAGASPGSQSNTQLEQHKWVLGLEEFNFIIRYPNLEQCPKYTISIDSLSSSPSIQKAVKKLHGQKKKKKKSSVPPADIPREKKNILQDTQDTGWSFVPPGHSPVPTGTGIYSIETFHLWQSRALWTTQWSLNC